MYLYFTSFFPIKLLKCCLNHCPHLFFGSHSLPLIFPGHCFCYISVFQLPLQFHAALYSRTPHYLPLHLLFTFPPESVSGGLSSTNSTETDLFIAICKSELPNPVAISPHSSQAMVFSPFDPFFFLKHFPQMSCRTLFFHFSSYITGYSFLVSFALTSLLPKYLCGQPLDHFLVYLYKLCQVTSSYFMSLNTMCTLTDLNLYFQR